MVLAELKHKLKCTGCTVFFSRWAQFEVYGVGAFLDRHNLQHMVLVLTGMQIEYNSKTYSTYSVGTFQSSFEKYRTHGIFLVGHTI